LASPHKIADPSSSIAELIGVQLPAAQMIEKSSKEQTRSDNPSTGEISGLIRLMKADRLFASGYTIIVKFTILGLLCQLFS